MAFHPFNEDNYLRRTLPRARKTANVVPRIFTPKIRNNTSRSVEFCNFFFQKRNNCLQVFERADMFDNYAVITAKNVP
jgi:hypothetical protein